MHIDRVRHASGVPGQSQSAEGPAGAGWEEVSIGRADVPGWSGAAPAAQNVLAHHELSVVLTDGTRRGPEAGVGRVGTCRPLPGVAEEAVGRDGRAWMGCSRGEDVRAEKVVAFTVGEC